jgi:hypothetical protein
MHDTLRRRGRPITVPLLVGALGLTGAITACSTTVPGSPTPTTASAAMTSPAHRPGGRAATFFDLRNAPVPALCEHDPGELRNMELPPQEGHRGDVGIALNYNTGAYKVAFGDLTGSAGDAAMVIHCNAGGVSWPETVQLYTAGARLDTATRLGGIDLSDLSHDDRDSVTDLSISDGVVHVTWSAVGPNDYGCCPTVEMKADLRWDGSTVVAQNVRRVK